MTDTDAIATGERETCPRCGKHVSYDCGCEDHQVLAVMVDPRDHADAIARLTTELAELRAAIFGGTDYATDLRNGNFVEMAQTLHAAQKGGLARAEKAERELADALAARTRRDAQMRAEGMRAAAEAAQNRWAIRREHAARLYEVDYPEAVMDSKTVGAKADEAESIAAEILTLAAQTEGAANG